MLFCVISRFFFAISLYCVILRTFSLHFQCAKEDFDKTIERCQDRILYDHTYYGSTIMEDFNLACDEEWKIPLVFNEFFFCNFSIL